MPDREGRFPFKVIEGGKSKKGRGTIQEESGFEPKILEGERDKELGGIPKAKDYRYKEFRDSKIEEEKIFTAEEIIEEIVEIARREGIDKERLEIVREGRDKEGNLIILSIGIKLSNEAIKRKWDKIVYDYLIKGEHDREESDITCITKTYIDMGEDLNLDDLSEKLNEGIIAVYNPGEGNEDGEWEYYIE